MLGLEQVVNIMGRDALLDHVVTSIMLWASLYALIR